MISSLNTIPPEFVRSENEQPGKTTFNGLAPAVPVINLSDTNFSQAIVDASRDWGIFQVINHGIPSDVIVELQRVGKEFFELPQEEKEAYAVAPGSGSLEGYGTSLQKEAEGKKAWTDYLFHNVWPPSAVNYNLWPKNPPSYRFASIHCPLHSKFLIYIIKLVGVYNVEQCYWIPKWILIPVRDT